MGAVYGDRALRDSGRCAHGHGRSLRDTVSDAGSRQRLACDTCVSICTLGQCYDVSSSVQYPVPCIKKPYGITKTLGCEPIKSRIICKYVLKSCPFVELSSALASPELNHVAEGLSDAVLNVKRVKSFGGCQLL